MNYTQSYSEYLDDLKRWYESNVDHRFIANRNQIMNILNEETKLMEIVKLIGSDVLPEDQKLTLEIAKVVRVGFLQQNAFHPEDTYVPLLKQFKMMDVILYLNHACAALIAQRKTLRAIVQTGIFETVTKIKYEVPNNQLDLFETYPKRIDAALASVE